MWRILRYQPRQRATRLCPALCLPINPRHLGLCWWCIFVEDHHRTEGDKVSRGGVDQAPATHWATLHLNNNSMRGLRSEPSSRYLAICPVLHCLPCGLFTVLGIFWSFPNISNFRVLSPDKPHWVRWTLRSVNTTVWLRPSFQGKKFYEMKSTTTN